MGTGDRFRDWGKKGWIAAALVALSGGGVARAEGTLDTGLGIDLRVDDDGSRPETILFVDIAAVGERICISAGNNDDTGDDITYRVYRPSGGAAVASGTINSGMPGYLAGNSGSGGFTMPAITDPVRVTTDVVGAWRVELDIDNEDEIDPWDVSVTPDGTTNPDPAAPLGRVYSMSWGFNALNYTRVSNSHFYPRVPGGRTGEEYVWLLDLNGLAGFKYEIIGNLTGVDSPNAAGRNVAGFSVDESGNSVTESFRIYLNPPTVNVGTPGAPPDATSFTFLDSAGVDDSISPSTSTGVQDTGTFRFNSDITGSYAIFIDLNDDGIFNINTGDVVLTGPAAPGLNSVTYNGLDNAGMAAPLGTHLAKLSLRTGEYHFVGTDIEMCKPGLRIFRQDPAVAPAPVVMFWSDSRFLSPTTTFLPASTYPDGVLSSGDPDAAPGGSDTTHNWGDASGESSEANQTFIDTYVIGDEDVLFSSFVVLATDANLSQSTMTVTDVTTTSTTQCSGGDVLEYTVALRNTGTESATSVVFDVTPPTSTALVVGSVTTTAGTINLGNGAGDTAVRVTTSVAASSTVTVTWRATVSASALAGSSLSAQGTIVATGGIDDRTDANLLTPADDPTTIGVLPPVVTFQNATGSVNENAGPATITVQLSNSSSLDVTVPFSVNLVSSTASSPADYTVTTSSPLTFTAGSTTRTISVTIADDGLDENDETVVLALGTPTNGTLGATTGHTLTIVDDENNTAPVLAAIGNRSVNELSLLSFTASASDTDLPADTLTWSLTGTPPAGVSIDASTGAFTFTPTEAQGPGDYPVTVRVTDNGSPSLFDEETITVTVVEVNVAPVLVAIGSRSLNELVTLSFTTSATDADLPANTLTYSLVSPPAGVSINGMSGTVSFTPTEAQGPGDYPVTVRVTDNGSPSLFDEETITITVLEVNAAPVLAAIGNRAVDELTALSFTASATDADLPANTLTYSLVGAPAGASIDGTSGAFSFTPTEAQGPGAYTFEVRVTDNGSPVLFDEETITVTVADVNTAPVLGTLEDVTVDEGTPIAFTASATDGDSPANTFTYSLVGAPAGASIDASTGAFAFTPSEAQGPGTYPFTVRVADSGSPVLTDEQQITVTVREVNLAPVLAAIGNRTVGEVTTLSFTATATDADLPANTLTYSLAGAPAGASIDGTSGMFSFTPTEAQGPGAYTFTVRVTDNGSPVLFDEESITVTVTDDNTAPVLAAIGGKDVDELTLLSFTSAATDGDAPANVLAFSLVGVLVPGVSIDAATGVFTFTPTEVQGPNAYTVTVRVTDDASSPLFDEETITITVREVNVAPVLAAIGDRLMDEETTLTITAAATDADLPANALTYSISGAPAGASVDPSTGAFSFAPTEAQGPSTFTVTFRVTDNGSPSLFAEETISIVVREVNLRPVLATIGDRTVDEGTLLSFTASATDADLPANTLTYSLVGAPAGAAIDATTGAFSFTPTEAQGPGTYTFDVLVTDNGSPVRTDEETITVTVADVNTAPVLAAIGDQEVDELTPLAFTAAATDGDLPANALTYSLVGTPPAGAEIKPATGQFAFTPTEAQGPGTYTVTVRVTDGAAGSPLFDEETITITVREVNLRPVLAAIGDKAVDEETLLSFTVTATDDDVPANTLAFSLVGAPAGAAIDPSTGAFTFTPTEAQGPGTYTFDVLVTDNGSPVRTDEETVTVTVGDVNTAPVLATIGDRTVDELTVLAFTALATDADAPPNTLTWSLVGAPAGAEIKPTTGELAFTPTEAQGPGTYTVTVRVADDDASSPLSDEETITITVVEVNLAPVLEAIGDRIVFAGTTLSISTSATDADLPANGLAFSLQSAPQGASIDPATGAFTFTPAAVQGQGSVTVTFRVTDDGSPNLFDEETITVTVVDGPDVALAKSVNTPRPEVGETVTFTLELTNAGPGAAVDTEVTDQLPAGTTYVAHRAGAGSSFDPQAGTWTVASLAEGATATLHIYANVDSLPLGTVVTNSAAITRTALPDVVGDNDVSTAAVTVAGPVPVAITTDPVLPEGMVGSPYVQPIESVGGVGPYRWRLIAGLLPPGLTLVMDGPTFRLEGVPSAPGGSYAFAVEIEDLGQGGVADSRSFTIEIRDAEPTAAPEIRPVAEVPGFSGQAFSFAFTSMNGEPGYLYSVGGGTLPPGLVLDPVTGVLAGTPTQPGTYTFCVDVFDRAGAVDTTNDGGCGRGEEVTVVVEPDLVRIVTLTLPPATVGAPYAAPVESVGGLGPDYTWGLEVVPGLGLPPGLDLSGSNAMASVAGTPTTAGTFVFLARVDDDGQPGVFDTQLFSVTVLAPGGAALVFDGDGLVPGCLGRPYEARFLAHGGTPAYTFALVAGLLPAGLMLDASGLVSGTPLVSGTATFNVAVHDVAGGPTAAVRRTVSLFIAAAPELVTGGTLPVAVAGAGYAHGLEVAGGQSPLRFTVPGGSLGTLPAGLELGLLSGVLSGTPTAAPGTYSFLVEVEDACGNLGSRVLELTVVAPGGLRVLTDRLPVATVGEPYAAPLLATGGLGGYSWSEVQSQLPLWATLDPVTGVIHGVPTEPGETTHVFRVTDEDAPAATADSVVLLLEVRGPLAITTVTLIDAVVGTSYVDLVQAEGGEGAYLWEIVSGDLPPGLFLDLASGGLAGEPAVSGTFTFAVLVIDARGTADRREYTIVVSAAKRGGVSIRGSGCALGTGIGGSGKDVLPLLVLLVSLAFFSMRRRSFSRAK